MGTMQNKQMTPDSTKSSKHFMTTDVTFDLELPPEPALSRALDAVSSNAAVQTGATWLAQGDGWPKMQNATIEH